MIYDQNKGAMSVFVMSIVIVILFALLNGLIITVLWNWIVTDLLHIRSIAIYEAVGLHLLIKSFNGGLIKYEGVKK